MASASDGIAAAIEQHHTSLYLANELKAVDELQHERTLAGSSSGSGSGSGDGEFNTPYHFAIDARGNLIIPDRDNSRIQAISENGEFVCKIGSFGTGEGQFITPTGVAINHSNGHIFVIESGNHRVQELEMTYEPVASLRVVRTFGTRGTGPGQFQNPYDIAISQRSTNLYVAEQGNKRVQELTAAGDHVRMIGVDSNPQYLISIALDEEDNIYVLNSTAHEVVVFNSEGSIVRKIGSQGEGDGQFNKPYSICIDPERDLVIVGDSKCIQAFNKQDGSFVHKLSDKMFWTLGVSVDSEGRIVAANYSNHSIERWA